MDECPTTSWFNRAEIRGVGLWSIYQGKERDPYVAYPVVPGGCQDGAGGRLESR
jgi:hypothetical protein